MIFTIFTFDRVSPVLTAYSISTIPLFECTLSSLYQHPLAPPAGEDDLQQIEIMHQ